VAGIEFVDVRRRLRINLSLLYQGVGEVLDRLAVDAFSEDDQQANAVLNSR
jgi:hypothetical protein